MKSIHLSALRRIWVCVAVLVLVGLVACRMAPGGEPTSPAALPTEQLPSEAPTIKVGIAFASDRKELQPGECATLAWNVEGGFGAEINGRPVEKQGQMEVCPTETTTYTLSLDAGTRLEQREVVITLSAGDQPPAASATAPVAIGVNVIRDVPYAAYTLDGQEQSLLLDLYLPEGGATPMPLLIFIHGGGWFEGSKDDCPAEALNQNGYAVACVDYRLAVVEGGCRPELAFPAQIHDVKAAVRWLRQNAATYGLDPERFAAMGTSSGSHLAVLLGVSAGVGDLQGSANPGVSEAVQVVVDWYGPVDVTQPPPELVFTDDPCQVDFAALNAKYGGEAVPFFYWTFAWSAFLGGSLADPAVLEQAHRATPLTYVDASDPPFLVIHGEHDDMFPIEQSELLVEALTQAGADVTFVRTPGGHSYKQPDGEIDPLFLESTLQFLNRYLMALEVSPQTGAATPSAALPPEQHQWVRTGGPPGGLGYDIRYNFDDPNTWYVTDAFAGVHLSTDNGRTWQPANNGIPPQVGHTGDSIPIFSLTVDPHNPQIVWAGTQTTGHIYKSTDGGRTWMQKDSGVTIEYDMLTFRGFTVDLRSSDIVYAMGETTSEAGGGPAVWGAGTGGIVYKTVDGGEHWEVLWDGGMPSSLARYMWTDPRDPDVLYVSTGLFDRGAVGEGDPETDPLGGIGILKSVDGGKTWQAQNEANGLEMLYLGSLYMHPENPDVLLAAAGHTTADRLAFFERYIRENGHTPSGVFRTEDGGEHWTRVLTSARAGEVFASVEICTAVPNIAYVASQVAVYRSQDAGQTWSQVSAGESDWGAPGVPAGFPIDIQCDPRNPDRLFVNNYGGGNFLSEDGGRSWANASQGYTGAQMRQVAVDPWDPARVYAVGRSGIWRSDDGGASWIGLNYPPSGNSPTEFTSCFDPSSVAVDLARSDHVLIGNVACQTILETFDGGFTWRLRATPESLGLAGFAHEVTRGGMPGTMFPSAIAFASSEPSTVYAGVSRDSCTLGHEPCLQIGVPVYRSRDGGEAWQPVAGGIPGGPEVIDLAVAPDNAAVVFAATGAGLFRSDDGGETWALLGGLPESAVARAVAVNPNDPGHLLVGIEGLGVYVSRDGGRAWEPGAAGLEPNGSLHDIVFDPTNPQTAYASDLRSGVYRSTDGGRTWTKINNGLRTRAALGLALSADGQHLYVATDGEGVFRLDQNGQPPRPAMIATSPPTLPAAVPTRAAPTAAPLGVQPAAIPTAPAKPSGGLPCGGAIALLLALIGLIWWKRRKLGSP